MAKTIVSTKGQVVIPKQVRDKLSLTPGTVLSVHLEGKRVILEPMQESPDEIFIQAGSEITEPILQEAKTTSDKAQKLLRDLGVTSD